MEFLNMQEQVPSNSLDLNLIEMICDFLGREHGREGIPSEDCILLLITEYVECPLDCPC
jgi:hypothetical protein